MMEAVPPKEFTTVHVERSLHIKRSHKLKAQLTGSTDMSFQVQSKELKHQYRTVKKKSRLSVFMEQN